MNPICLACVTCAVCVPGSAAVYAFATFAW